MAAACLGLPGMAAACLAPWGGGGLLGSLGRRRRSAACGVTKPGAQRRAHASGPGPRAPGPGRVPPGKSLPCSDPADLRDRRDAAWVRLFRGERRMRERAVPVVGVVRVVQARRAGAVRMALVNHVDVTARWLQRRAGE